MQAGGRPTKINNSAAVPAPPRGPGIGSSKDAKPNGCAGKKPTAAQSGGHCSVSVTKPAAPACGKCCAPCANQHGFRSGRLRGPHRGGQYCHAPTTWKNGGSFAKCSAKNSGNPANNPALNIAAQCLARWNQRRRFRSVPFIGSGSRSFDAALGGGFLLPLGKVGFDEL